MIECSTCDQGETGSSIAIKMIASLSKMKGYFRENCKSQNNSISQTPKSTLGIIHIKAMQTIHPF